MNAKHGVIARLARRRRARTALPSTAEGGITAADGQRGVVEGDADGFQGDGVDAVGWCGGKGGIVSAWLVKKRRFGLAFERGIIGEEFCC